jgi:hypothetical protein
LSVRQVRAADVLCSNGVGKLDATIRTGVKVHVGAARNEGFATRACSAKLAWENQELTVASSVYQLDLDAIGVDFGDGVPAAAFQIRKSEADCCMEYRIYSLVKPARLLRTITGGDLFTASDTHMDGSVEIWTHDTAALNGFERLSVNELDSAPTVVFRLTQGQLVDVSSEFQAQFDIEIAKLKSGIQAQDLKDFKSSDGKLESNDSTSVELLHRLRLVKIKALEIVWAYLYSGREQDAWRSLAEMWPATDVNRIRGAMENARSRGIHSQADVTLAGPSDERKKHVHIFDAENKSHPENEISMPQAILLRRPPSSNVQNKRQMVPAVILKLLIDEAGKVRAAEPVLNTKADPELINATTAWKFIPAFKNDRPVACRILLGVSSQQ